MKTKLHADDPHELSAVTAHEFQSLRSSSPTSEGIECVLMCRLFHTIAASTLVTYPITVKGTAMDGKNQERPDFQVSMQGSIVGLEVTEATHPDYRWAFAVAENMGGGMIEPCMFRPGSRIPKRRGLRPAVRAANQPLIGRGWQGAEVEREWVQYISEAIRSKTIDLHKSGFSRFSENWLLIGDMTPVSMFIRDSHLESALDMLHTGFMNEYWRNCEGYDSIFIRCQDVMIHLNQNGTYKHSILQIEASGLPEN